MQATWLTRIGMLGCVAAMGLLWVAGSVTAASQSHTVSIDRLFVPDNVDLQPGAIDRVKNIIEQVRGPLTECPIDAKITIPQLMGDNIWQGSLANARRDALKDALGRLNLPRVAYNIGVTPQQVGMNTVDIDVGVRRDRERPTLLATSTPRPGTRVQARDKIEITITARDQANLWQTGIRGIQIHADAEHGRLIALENFTPPTPDCVNRQPERRVSVTYVVPDDPPPIVRLTARSWDPVGNEGTGVVEFPTKGDWYGTITWFFHNKEEATADHNGSEAQFNGSADFTLRYDGRGNLNGSLQGSWKIDKHWWGYPERGEVCSGSVPATPVSGDLVGSYTPGAETLTLHPTAVVAKVVVPQHGGGPHLQCVDIPFDYSSTLAALLRSRLERVSDGIYRAGSNSDSPQQVFRYTLRVQRVLRPN